VGSNPIRSTSPPAGYPVPEQDFNYRRVLGYSGNNIAATSWLRRSNRGEINVVLVVALEIRDLVEGAWKAYRAHRVERSRSQHTPQAPRAQLPKVLAPSA
jgi:hypothetical protein